MTSGQDAVEATAPARVDLAGGTVDIWPLYLFHHEAVTLNAALHLRVEVRVARQSGSRIRLTDRDQGRTVDIRAANGSFQRKGYELFCVPLRHFRVQGGLQVEFSSAVPKGAGLAGSSALMAAFCSALARLQGERISKARFIELIRDLETRLIRVPAGLQDYYPAIYGGVQALWWQGGGVRREALAVRPEDLEKHLLLVYTGRSRPSGVNNWEVFKRHLDGNRQVRRLFDRIVAAAQAMYGALRRGDYPAAGQAMAREYQARKGLFPGIATREIDALEGVVMRKGALGFKVCGAGGGGCVVIFVDPERRESVREGIRQEGFVLLPLRVSRRGLLCRPSRSGHSA